MAQFWPFSVISCVIFSFFAEEKQKKQKLGKLNTISLHLWYVVEDLGENQLVVKFLEFFQIEFEIIHCWVWYQNWQIICGMNYLRNTAKMEVSDKRCELKLVFNDFQAYSGHGNFHFTVEYWIVNFIIALILWAKKQTFTCLYISLWFFPFNFLN